MSAARLAERYTDGMTHGTQNAGSSFGCNGLGGASWNITNGDIAETIYYSDDLNDAERIIVENYLSAKYDIALTANDVYTGDEAINGDYDWGVAGIGQITGTSQAVTSHTVASSAGLVISDTGFLQNNGDFVMFGYTTTVNSWVHTDLPAGVVRRWERDWYLDITDVVTQGGGVDIAFDFSAGGIGDTPGGAYALLERDSASGDFSVVTTTHTISGSQVIFHLDASDLEDDHYYTLGAGITKAVNDPIPNPGEMITYTITVGNSDAFAYTDAVISDTLPVSLTFANNVVIDPPQPGAVVATTAADLPTLVSNLTIASGERVTVTFNAIVTSTVTGGMLITNTAAVTSTQVVTPQRASVGLSINYAPVATATVDSAYINLCDTTTLRGNTSDDPDGHLPLSYHWKQTGGPGVDGIANPFTHTTIFTGSCSAEGVITFTLTVTDSLDLADPTPDIVTVTVKNVPVDGLSVANSSTTTLGCTTYFTAEITDGSSVTYTWDFGDGTAPIVTTDSAHKSYAGHIYAPACVTTPITYTVVVTAQNGFITGTPPVYTTYTDTTTTIVTITNEAPVAVAGVAPPVDRHQQAVVDSLVTLDASDSYDPDAASCGSNDITEYHWEWTGGIVSVTLSDNSAISPTFTAPSPPTLPTVISFTLTVTDTGCLSATDLISITLVPTVGGHTAPVETSALLWPWVALVAVLGAMAAVVATALRRRTAHREFP